MPIEIAAAFSVTASALKLTWEFVRIAVEIEGAPENARVFVRLVRQVKQDLEHALECRAEVLSSHSNGSINDLPPHYGIWIRNTLQAVMDELEDFTLYLDKRAEGRDLPDRVRYLLFKFPELTHRERGLRIAHARLLQAIGLMHLLTISGGHGQSGKSSAAGALPVGSPSPKSSLHSPSSPDASLSSQLPLRRRASRRPPGLQPPTPISFTEEPESSANPLPEMPAKFSKREDEDGVNGNQVLEYIYELDSHYGV
ncbi:hypothetical protein JX265_006961 [Neoarthrinium moseri]|uniref:Fungal N-terminal domain-containing protein n=1 Tax=Neoarthrinium moseri TaxID=1658444 RepID=A0A9P9WLC9_9PEZI|nr:hypothetical protein JX265_006961 [Neoarthrinium moseri]